MSKLTTDLLLVAMRDHIGIRGGVTATKLVDEINQLAGERVCRERDLRSVVEKLREEGHHVCAHPKTGYFIAANADELQLTCEFLTSRAMRSLKQVSAMKRVSVPDLMGQMHFPT